MKQRLEHPKFILKEIVLTLVVLLFLQATQTSALAVQPQVAAGGPHTVGVKSDGTVVAVGSNYSGQLNVGSWTDIVQVAAGSWYTVGVKFDGTVVAVGDNSNGQINVGSWTDIVQVAAGNNDEGYSHTVGVKSDGTVVAVGSNYSGQLNVGNWTNIVQVTAGFSHTVGVKSDGTVVAVGDNFLGECNVSSWTDIVKVAAGENHTVGLKSEGTVVAVGRDYNGQLNVGSWTDIVQVSAGWEHTVGVKSDGTVVAVGRNDYGQLNVGSWTDIVQVAAGGYHTVGVKSDGTVVAVGLNDSGQINVGSWRDIVQVGAGFYHTVGVKSNGTVVAVGWNLDGQLNLFDWDLQPDFTDVSPGFWAEDHIYAIFNAGITKGCAQNPLMYCPKKDVSRDQMAAFLVRAVEGEPPANHCGTGSPFSDVSPATGFCKYIKRLSELGITKGCGGGKYCPKTTVKRDQMAAFLVRAVEGEPAADYCGTSWPFSDVDPASVFCKYIKRLSELGITKGCGGGKYCPKTTVKRDQMAVFLGRAFLGMD